MAAEVLAGHPEQEKTVVVAGQAEVVAEVQAEAVPPPVATCHTAGTPIMAARVERHKTGPQGVQGQPVLGVPAVRVATVPAAAADFLALHPALVREDRVETASNGILRTVRAAAVVVVPKIKTVL